MSRFIVFSVDNDKQQTFICFARAGSHGCRTRGGAQAARLLLSRRGLHRRGASRV